MMSDFGGGGEDDILVLVGDDDLDHSNTMLDATPPHHHHHPNPSSPAAAAQYDHDFSNIRQIEQFLLNEDDIIDMYPQEEGEEDRLTASLGFLSDIILDSPLPSDPSSPDNPSPESDFPYSNHNSNSDSDAKDVQQPPNLIGHQELLPPAAIPHPHQEEKEGSEAGQLNNNGDDADPISKKRKRQLRNRDAAVRSRERKKMYIKDLEIKSRYYEAECRRLGMLLQCYLAENHALRLSLNTTTTTQAFDASTTKQESAVLILESLLLGSLLWFLGIVALLTLPRQLSNLGAKKVGCKIPGSLAPREAGIKIHGTLEFKSFMMSKRCRGSRRKMRCSFKLGLAASFRGILSVTPCQFLAFC
ncbi:bZIP transcription factor 60 [Coffea eugenioides]|uniref:bZIP transcription factor 60 n=1 Tax=Coffea eugenioides TaxID=49369 RepID=UPI000F60852F|nr:bZIP transcription factor 60 [Coffea eugenioides]